LIKVLREEKSYSSRRFLNEFPNRNWSRRGQDELIKKIDRFGSIQHRPGAGRPRSVRTDDNVDRVADLVQSQENRPQTHRTVRQISRDTGICRSSVHRIIKTDLHLKCLKKERAQELTEANRPTRLEQSHRLLLKYPFVVSLVTAMFSNKTAHRARDTVEMLRKKTPDFIPPDLWPTNVA
jgi:hypothetical protein